MAYYVKVTVHPFVQVRVASRILTPFTDAGTLSLSTSFWQLRSFPPIECYCQINMARVRGEAASEFAGSLQLRAVPEAKDPGRGMYLLTRMKL